MSAQPAAQLEHDAADVLLDVDTSAAVLHWMETARIPQGVDPQEWERWVDGGCTGRLEADGALVNQSMLGRWAHSGSLR